MKRIRVGVIGVGYLGRFHAEKYARMEAADLVGVVDIDGEKARQVAGTAGTKAYTDYKDLLGIVDAVSIVVPTPAHFEVAKDFLENGVDVLIEKPMTTTLENADELIKYAEARDLIIQVGHLERFNPAVVALRDIVNRPRFIEAHRLSIYKERCTDVSVVLDLMIHDIDIILSFVGSQVKNIHAAGIPVVSSHTDIANARIEFENGCVTNITASRISTRDERKIRFFQRDAYWSLDFAKQEIAVIKKGANGNNGLIPGMNIERIVCAKGDVLEDELKSFVNAVIRREAPQITGQMGRDALKVALNIMQQIDTANSHFSR